MTTKDVLHQLVDDLPDSELTIAEEYLRRLRDPVLRAFFEAPEDDEPETEEERAAIEEARAEIAAGQGIAWEAIRDRLRQTEEA